MKDLIIVFSLSTAILSNSFATPQEFLSEEKFTIPGLVILATPTQPLLDLNRMDEAREVVLKHLHSKPGATFAITTPKGVHVLKETVDVTNYPALQNQLDKRQLIDRPLVQSLVTLAQSDDDNRWVNFFKAIADKELDEKILNLASKLNNKSIAQGLPNYREMFYFKEHAPWDVVEYTIDLVLRLINPERKYELTLDSFFNGQKHYDYSFHTHWDREDLKNLSVSFVNGFFGFMANYRVDEVLKRSRAEILGFQEKPRVLDMFPWE